MHWNPNTALKWKMKEEEAKMEGNDFKREKEKREIYSYCQLFWPKHMRVTKSVCKKKKMFVLFFLSL